MGKRKRRHNRHIRQSEESRKEREFVEAKEHTSEQTLFKQVETMYKKNKVVINTIFLIILLVIPMFYSGYFRAQPYVIPKAEEWAASSVASNVKAGLYAEQKANYPNMPEEQLQSAVNNQYRQLYNSQKADVDKSIKAQADNIRAYLQDDTGQTYLIAIDPYVWYGHAKHYLDNGRPGDTKLDGKYYYSLRDGRNLRPMSMTFHDMVIVWTHRLISPFTGQNIMASAFAIPMIFGILMIIPTFFIARRLTNNDISGFFAAMIMGIHGALLTRTVAGFSDTDIYTTFFPLLITWLFIEGFHSQKNWKKYTLYALAGLATALFLHTWGGWWYIFLFVVGSMIGYVCIFLFKDVILLKKNIKESGKRVWEKLLSIGVYFLSSFVFTIIFAAIFLKEVPWAIGYFFNSLKAPFSFMVLKDVVSGTNIWPNVLTTVAELNAATTKSIINTVGTKLMLFFVLTSLCLLPFKNRFGETKVRIYIACSAIYNGILAYQAKNMGSLWTFIILALLPAAIGIIFYLLQKDYEIDESFFMELLLFVWIAGTFYAATKGIRFTALSVPAIAVAAGVGIVLGAKFLSLWLEEVTDWNKKGYFAVMVIASLFLFVTPMNNAQTIAESEVPSFNDGWNTLLNKINADDTDGIIASWWDFGHWFVAMGDRRVVFDGGDQGKRIHWIGNSLLTGDEHQSLAVLRMLNCGGENGYKTMYNYTNEYSYTSVMRIKEIIMLPQEEAKQKLVDYGYTIEQIDEIMGFTHCDDLLPQYYIASEDMVGKSGVWAHFGSWDFTRAKMYSDVKLLKDAEKSVTYLQENFELTQQEASKYYGQIMTQGADTWVSSWPRYMSNEHGCQKVGNTTHTCNVPIDGGNGQRVTSKLTIDTEKNTIVFDAIEGGVPEKASLVKGNDVIVLESSEKNNLGVIADVNENGKYTVLLSDPLLVDSIFTKMFYLEGAGLEFYESFDYTQTMFGQRIYTYKVDWEGYLAKYD